MKTRLSLGSAVLLGLKAAPCDALPTTVYLMLGGRCVGNCAFCTQALSERERECGEGGQRKLDQLSRIIWPEFPLEDILDGLKKHKGRYQRICLQCLNYKGMVADIKELVSRLRKEGIQLPVSVSAVPVAREDMMEMKKAGVSQMTFSLDAATEELFDQIKGAERHGHFSWEDYTKALKESKEIFGTAFSHLIIGVGETDREALSLIDELYKQGIKVSLFAFTPVTKKGVGAPAPLRYHSLQLAARLLYEGLVSFEGMEFDGSGSLVKLPMEMNDLRELLEQPDSWLNTIFNTFGCEDCNRPFYNERPGGPIYNYPETPRTDVVMGVLEELREQGVI